MNTIGRDHKGSNAGARLAQDDPLNLWRETASSGSALVRPAEVLLFLRRNVLNILVGAALVAALLFSIFYFVFNRYSATAVVLVDPRAAKITQSGGVLANIGADAIAIESMVQVTHADSFLGAVVDKLELTKDPNFGGKGASPELARLATIEKLGSKLTIARRGTTYVIDITATAPSAEQAAKIANAAAQKIVDDQTKLRTGASSDTAKEIEGRLAELRGRVNRAEEAVAQLRVRLKVTDAGQRGTLLEQRVAGLNEQLILAGAKTAEARARFELLRKAGATFGSSLPQAIQSTVLNTLRAEYARLTRQAADQATVLGPRHPDVASLQAQISDVRRQIGAEIGRMMTTAKNEYLEAEQRENALSSQLRTAQTESGELGPALVRLGELDREAKAERNIYEQLLSRQRELTQVQGLEPSDIRIVSYATPPTKTSPSRILLAAGACVLGLLSGLIYALAREWGKNTLKTSSQAERLGRFNAIGFAPLLHAAKSRGHEQPDLTPWLADFCLELKSEKQDEFVAFVTSTTRGEGRSTIATNLATFFADGGESVLLVEADRSPSDERAREGLLDVLETGEDLRAAFVETPDGYTLLPFGDGARRRDGISSLLSGVTMRAALKLARQWFDVVIIEGPPALEAAYARQLAGQADQIVFVVEWDKTSPADADAALERLDHERVALLYNKADPARLRLYDPDYSRFLSRQAGSFPRAA